LLGSLFGLAVYEHYVLNSTFAGKPETSAQTLTQARSIRAQKLADAEKQRVLGYAPPSKDTFAEFEPRYLQHQKARLTPLAYARTHGIVENHLHSAFGSVRLAEIRRADVQRYITQRTGRVGTGSVIKEFNVLKHMLNLAVQWELIAANHAHGVRPPKAPAGRVRYLQPTEVKALLAACPAWLQPVVLLLLATGMRRGELLKLRWLDVDRAGNRFLLPQTKNGEARIVWLNALACGALDSLPRAKNARPTDTVLPRTELYEPHNVSVAFLRACRRAKIEDFRLHDLRHTCASWMRMQGADIHVVAQQLGHKDLRMAIRYQHLAPTFLQDAVRRLDTVFSPQLAAKPQEAAQVSGNDGVTMAALNGHKPALTSTNQLPA
jgi:integrase